MSPSPPSGATRPLPTLPRTRNKLAGVPNALTTSASGAGPLQFLFPRGLRVHIVSRVSRLKLTVRARRCGERHGELGTDVSDSDDDHVP